MKTLIAAAWVLGLGILCSNFVGCATGEPGVKNYAGTYTANVDAKPDKATNAAKKALEDLKFMNITASSTKIDGKVEGTTAQNDKVTIKIDQAGDNVSAVSVRVGNVGDEAISKQIIDKTKENLRWF